VTPAALLLFFVVIQMSLLYYGESVATTAAQHGVDAARVQDSTAAAGRRAVDEFVDQAGGIEVTGVDVDRGADEVTVTVDANPLEVLPGFPFKISATLSAPVEQVVD
jgi:hypothetical protein